MSEYDAKEATRVMGEDEEEEEEEYEVEKILAFRIHKRSRQYLLKWVGFLQPTWEKEENLVDPSEEFKSQMIVAKNAYALKIGETVLRGNANLNDSVDEETAINNCNNGDEFEKNANANNVYGSSKSECGNNDETDVFARKRRNTGCSNISDNSRSNISNISDNLSNSSSSSSIVGNGSSSGICKGSSKYSSSGDYANGSKNSHRTITSNGIRSSSRSKSIGKGSGSNTTYHAHYDCHSDPNRCNSNGSTDNRISSSSRGSSSGSSSSSGSGSSSGSSSSGNGSSSGSSSSGSSSSSTGSRSSNSSCRVSPRTRTCSSSSSNGSGKTAKSDDWKDYTGPVKVRKIRQDPNDPSKPQINITPQDTNINWNNWISFQDCRYIYPQPLIDFYIAKIKFVPRSKDK